MTDRDAALRRLRDALLLTRAAIDDLIDDLDTDITPVYEAELRPHFVIGQLEGEES